MNGSKDKDASRADAAEVVEKKGEEFVRESFTLPGFGRWHLFKYTGPQVKQQTRHYWNCVTSKLLTSVLKELSRINKNTSIFPFEIRARFTVECGTRKVLLGTFKTRSVKTGVDLEDVLIESLARTSDFVSRAGSAIRITYELLITETLSLLLDASLDM